MESDDKIYQQTGPVYGHDSVILWRKTEWNQFPVEQGDLRMLDTHGNPVWRALANRYLLMPGFTEVFDLTILRDHFSWTQLSDFRATGSDGLDPGN